MPSKRPPRPAPRSGPRRARVTLPAEDVHGVHALPLQRALRRLPGVTRVTVDVGACRVTVHYNPRQTTVLAIAQRIHETGHRTGGAELGDGPAAA